MLLLSNIRRIFGSGTLFIIDIMVYSFICGSNLQRANIAGMTSFEYVLFCVTNHYFILYFLLIAFMLLITKYIKQTQDIQLIRYESKKRWMRTESLSLLSFSLLFSLTHLAIPCIIGLPRLPYRSTFSFEQQSNAWNEMADLLQEYGNWFSSPAIASICAILFLALGFWLISLILRKVLTEFGMRNVLIVMAGIIVNTFIGFKTSADDIAFPLFINKYLILHHTLFSNGWLGVLVIICVPCLLFVIFGINFRSKRSVRNIGIFDSKQFLSISIISRSNLLRVLVVTFIYCMFSVISFTFVEKSPGVSDFVMYMFLGGSGQSLVFKDFLSYVLMISVPLYFIAVNEEKVRAYQSTPMMIRFEKKSNFERAVWRVEIRFLLIYLFILLSFIALCGIGLGLKSNRLYGGYFVYIANALGVGLETALRLLFIGIAVRAAELFLIVTIFRFVLSFTKKTSLSFIVALSGYVILLLPIRFNLFLPYGAGSLSRTAYFYSRNWVAPCFVLIFISCIFALFANRSINRKGVGKR